jgi:hypothetical protein
VTREVPLDDACPEIASDAFLDQVQVEQGRLLSILRLVVQTCCQVSLGSLVTGRQSMLCYLNIEEHRAECGAPGQ